MMFKTLNLSLTYILMAFIAAPVCTVLSRGLPYVPAVLRSPETAFAFKMSMFTSMVSTLLCLVIGLPVAYALARHDLPNRPLVSSVLRIPLNLPPVVSGVCLLLFFGATRFGQFLSELGIRFVFTVPGIVLAQFFVNVPSLITVLESAIKGVDSRLEFVARTLGCSPFTAFKQVTLPLIRNGLVAGVMLTWGKALGEFGAVLMLAGATRFKTETLPIAIYLNMSIGDLDAMMALSAILITTSIVSLVVLQRMGIKVYGRVADF